MKVNGEEYRTIWMEGSTVFMIEQNLLPFEFQIYEANTYFDTCFANPPFMTPKGGIRPHNRFGITSKKAELLFVDYIIDHLNQFGKAGIIVPEGVLFQNNSAFKQVKE